MLLVVASLAFYKTNFLQRFLLKIAVIGKNVTGSEVLENLKLKNQILKLIVIQWPLLENLKCITRLNFPTGFQPFGGFMWRYNVKSSNANAMVVCLSSIRHFRNNFEVLFENMQGRPKVLSQKLSRTLTFIKYPDAMIIRRKQTFCPIT